MFHTRKYNDLSNSSLGFYILKGGEKGSGPNRSRQTLSYFAFNVFMLAVFIC